MFLLILSASLSFVQDPAPAALPSPTPEEAASTEQAEREARLDEVVCRREHLVGSNRARRVCQTRRQWDAEYRRGQINGEPERGEGRVTQDESIPVAGGG